MLNRFIFSESKLNVIKGKHKVWLCKNIDYVYQMQKCRGMKVYNLRLKTNKRYNKMNDFKNIRFQ